MKNLFKIAVLLLFLFFGFNTSHAMGQFFMMENSLVGEEAKDFTLETLSGNKVSMNQFRDGKKAIIFFWATWCPHCQEQLRELNEQKSAIEGKGIKIILVDVGEKKAKVASYVTKNNISMEIFLDPALLTSDEYAVIGVPTLFFTDENGNVKAVKHALPNDLDEIFLK